MYSKPLHILITGAGSGIGKSIALEYAKLGCNLIMIGRRAETLAITQAEALSLGANTAIFNVADVRSETQMQDAINSHPYIDICIANSGISGNPFGKPQLENAREIIETNYFGVLNTIWPCISKMQRNGGGQIVVISSIASFIGMPTSPVYNSSKAAISSYIDGIRPSLNKQGLSVTLICPGFVSTPLVAENPYPMPFIMPAEVAAQKIIKAISRKKKLYAFPLQMYIMARIGALLPPALRDFIFKGVKGKEGLQ